MKIILAMMVFVVLSTIGLGLKIWINNENKTQSGLKKLFIGNLVGFTPLVAMALLIIVPDLVFAATTEGLSSSAGLGFIAAALSTGMAAIGAGYAVGVVGSAALGAVSEDEKILGKTLIFVGLAEGIAIYGLIISILILGRL
ncbi:V/A-type H+-transporting ATPase subunit K [Acetoanaerobium pronyense]|uniref:ATP synthase F(0) sector subunit c n=1 Tax=Acetoanaerobium pronyense TaxID=1482736 RepID=A0ABS4KJ28_9FIRM|nr:ATP synthase subunit C [Acetoanaerobium pronyense]MBP2027759.1 V/A-type H+-transporting ATPase subunit K [Acetoanaerobium pronyense]